MRPLLAARWLERYGVAPPIEFQKLLHLVEDSPALVADIETLLERKRAAPEMGLEPPVPSIHSFIQLELERLESIEPPGLLLGEAVSRLNEVFQVSLHEAWA